MGQNELKYASKAIVVNNISYKKCPQGSWYINRISVWNKDCALFPVEAAVSVPASKDANKRTR